MLCNIKIAGYGTENGKDVQRFTIAETFEDYVHTRARINWMEEREKELMGKVREAEPGKLGYLRRLTTIWNCKYPDLRTTETALARRLYVIRSRMVEPNNCDSDPEAMDEGQTDQCDIVVSIIDQ